MTVTGTGSVSCTFDEYVATITLARAEKLNALTPEMLDDLLVAVERVRQSSARVIVVRGDGVRAFCVGADINRFADLSPVQMLDWTTRGHRAFDALASLPQATVAALHGPTFGGGLELALACDFRLAAANTTLGLPEVGLGTVPGWGGTERLVELVGRSRTKEIILARRTIDAATALTWGLVTTVADADGFESALSELTTRIAEAAPVAVRLAKTIIDAAADGAPSRVLEQLAGAVTCATEDLAIGISGFRDRTTPAFTGR
jgi:enoyl-CoA hydratase/carnithine racemase